MLTRESTGPAPVGRRGPRTRGSLAVAALLGCATLLLAVGCSVSEQDRTSARTVRQALLDLPGVASVEIDQTNYFSDERNDLRVVLTRSSDAATVTRVIDRLTADDGLLARSTLSPWTTDFVFEGREGLLYTTSDGYYADTDPNAPPTPPPAVVAAVLTSARDGALAAAVAGLRIDPGRPAEVDVRDASLLDAALAGIHASGIDGTVPEWSLTVDRDDAPDVSVFTRDLPLGLQVRAAARAVVEAVGAAQAAAPGAVGTVSLQMLSGYRSVVSVDLATPPEPDTPYTRVRAGAAVAAAVDAFVDLQAPERLGASSLTVNVPALRPPDPSASSSPTGDLALVVQPLLTISNGVVGVTPGDLGWDRAAAARLGQPAPGLSPTPAATATATATAGP